VGVSTRLKLATRRDIERRVQDLLNFYKREYGYAVFAGERSFHVKNLLFTQSFVKSDKRLARLWLENIEISKLKPTEPFVPRWSFPLFRGFSGSHLGTSASPTGIWWPLWGHGWLSSPTARGSHLPSTHLGLEQSSHRLGGGLPVCMLNLEGVYNTPRP